MDTLTKATRDEMAEEAAEKQRLLKKKEADAKYKCVQLSFVFRIIAYQSFDAQLAKQGAAAALRRMCAAPSSNRVAQR